MDETTALRRLMALAKLRSEGLSPLLRRLECVPSNAITAANGLRAPQAGLVDKLKTALRNDEAGFTDLCVEAWLGRSVDDLESLVTKYGFEVRLLTRLLTDREQQGKSHQYKFCLLHVGFAKSGRYVVLRMTHDKLDEFIARLKLKEVRKIDWVAAEEAKPPEKRSVLDYAACLQPLMELNFMLEDRLEVPATFAAFVATAGGKDVRQTTDAILNMIEAYLKNPGPIKAKRAKHLIPAGSLSVQAGSHERNLIARSIEDMLRSSHDITRERSKEKMRLQLMGVTNAGALVPCEMEVIFQGEKEERINKPSDPAEHLVVTQVHSSGLVEIIFNGPTNILYEGVEALDSTDPGRPYFKAEMPRGRRMGRNISTQAIRILGQTVPYKDRLKIREASH